MAHPYDNQGTVPVAGDTCMQCHKGEVRNWVIRVDFPELRLNPEIHAGEILQLFTFEGTSRLAKQIPCLAAPL